ncbi:MAG: SDR family oxidoreductase [Firmicutes bacterium]|nr:SDR family oxidoreductase [Bacillota bacterium]
MRLQDKVVIVTGAARGIGQAFALGLAKEGAKVVAADMLEVTDTMDKVKAEGGTIIGINVDVSHAGSTRDMASETMKEFGNIDVIVNNAAIWGGLKFKPMDLISEEEWDAVFAVNVKGVWQCCKAVVPYMKEQGKGSIINISSASIFQGIPLLGHYVASKGAIWAYTRSLSREIGEFGIRVNSISPGYTMTQASKNLSDDQEQLDYIYNLNIDQRIIKRAMYSEDLIGALLFLASDDSAFITGQNINVDGGSYHY